MKCKVCDATISRNAASSASSVSATLSFCALQKDIAIDQATVDGYKVYFATSCGMEIGAAITTMSKTAIGDCCDGTLYSATHTAENVVSDSNGEKATLILIVPYKGAVELDRNLAFRSSFCGCRGCSAVLSEKACQTHISPLRHAFPQAIEWPIRRWLSARMTLACGERG